MTKYLTRTFPLSLCLLVGLLSLRGSQPAAAASEPPVFLGIYPNAGVAEINAIHAWIRSTPGLGSKGISIAGTFIDPEIGDPNWVVTNEVGVPWDNGYVPFINLMTTRTATDVANGGMDAALTAWANAFKAWAGSTKRAFIAPMPEMNGYWVPYSESTTNFKLAFLRIQRIFADAGVPDSAVSWTFAPNYVSIGRPSIEEYYPGNTVVDVVGFSAYNYGTCIPGGSWSGFSFDNLFKPALDGMRYLAPSKPIFIAQTGVLQGGNRSDYLEDMYTRFAAYPAVRAILYFHKAQSEAGLTGAPCYTWADYRFYYGGSSGEQGILDALQLPDFDYWSPSDPGWTSTAFTPGPQGNFDDVWPAHPFAGVEDEWYNTWVDAIFDSGLTTGCSTAQYSLPGYTLDLTFYCPGNPVTRAEMAVFLKKGIHGAGYSSPAPDGSHPFSDINAHWAEAWIEDLFDEGMTSGYPDGTFRPENSVTRAEMAIFLLKAKHGSGYSPPAPSGGSFTDVTGHWAEAWIEQLKDEGITSGYPDGSYRPENNVTRGEMAVFLVKAFSLPMP